MAIERRPRPCLSGAVTGGNARGVMGALAVADSRQRGAGHSGLQAAPVAAPALSPGDLVEPWPGQGVVTPFAGDVVATPQHFAVHHHAAAAAGAENDAEH